MRVDNAPITNTPRWVIRGSFNIAQSVAKKKHDCEGQRHGSAYDPNKCNSLIKCSTFV